MEFRHSKAEHRHDRRICPNCEVPHGTKRECPRCGAQTKARIRIVWYVDGKRERELTYCWREKDAQALLRRKEADYWRQQELGVDRAFGGSLRQGVDAFKATVAECSDDYKKQIDTALNALGQGLGWGRPLTGISSQEIDQYKAEGLAALSSASVRSYMLVVRRLFRYLHEEGWIRRNPASKVKLPTAKKGRDHLRPEEVGLVLSKFWEVAPEVAPIAMALVLGGWRKGEIINLRHGDVYLADRWAYVLDYEGDEWTSAWSPKTQSSWRAVPLHPLVARVLTKIEQIECPDGRMSPWVFPVTDSRKRRRYQDKLGRPQPVYGDRRSPKTTFLGGKLREVLAAAGVKRRVTVHGLRRTFAVLLQESGAPDTIIRQALGHGARGVTEVHYLPRRDETLKRWVDAIQVTIPGLEVDAIQIPELEVDAIQVTIQGLDSVAPDPSPPTTQPETRKASPGPYCPPTAPRPGANRPPYLRLVE